MTMVFGKAVYKALPPQIPIQRILDVTTFELGELN